MKTLFITGAAQGIGLATARHFATLGWFVGLYDINEKALQEVMASGDFPNACAHRCDVTSRQSIEEALEHFAQHTNGRLDLLVNNAGVLTSGNFEDVDGKDHELIIKVNVQGVTDVAQLAFPLLRDTPGATLLNLCSASSIHGIPLLAVYSASKYYVNGLTEALNIEWAKHDIRVTSVKPPVVNTAMGHALSPELMEKLSMDMEPPEVARSIQLAAEGKSTGYLLGSTARIWGMVDKFLPEAGRRRLVRYLTNQ